ncbi:MAG: hypothetical protein GF311_21540 [Candidatus Lokiarchaeota archaeon]|nr:hypothetical protein [Candidatus Lokiarchaeota archaeon]
MTMRKKINRLKFPIRLLNRRQLEYKFEINLGHNLKFKLRSIARTNFPHIYHKPIVFPQDPQFSEENDMTVGRWIFGIPNYKGHIIAFEDKAWIPKDSPEIVKALMKQIQKQIKK